MQIEGRSQRLDELIGLLVFICIFAVSASKKKKKSREKNDPPQRTSSAQKSSFQTKFPFSKDEWTNFLKELESNEGAQSPRPSKGKPAPAKQNDATPAKRTSPEPAEPAVSVLTVPPEHAEGAISTQGESDAEHELHLKQVRDAEQAQQEEHEALLELRRMNREKLRSAVVMSEVLGRPVSLRSRAHR